MTIQQQQYGICLLGYFFFVFIYLLTLYSPCHLTYRGLGRAIPMHALQTTNMVFLAHLSQWLMGELIVYQSLPPPSVRPSVRQHFQTSSPLKPLGQLNSNFIRILLRGYSLGRGNESLLKWSWSHDQDGRHAHIW